ncbi:MAG: S41 family peptidase [Flavobacteriales bacterium]
MRPIGNALAVVLASAVISASAQTARNLDFSEPCDTCKTGLAHWSVSWANDGVVCQPEYDDGNPALRISSTKDGVGFVEQTVPLDARMGASILELTGRVRSVSLVGRGAGLNVGIYDSAGTFLTNKDMGFGSFSWVNGTQDWRTLSVKVLCPPEARTVRIGAIRYGEGEAWFDDYNLVFTPLAGRTADAKARAYVDAACDTIARRSLHRATIDLKAMRNTAMQVAGSDGDPRDLHMAVEYLLASIGDHHSFLMKPEEVKGWKGDDGPPAEIEHATYRVLEGCGYVSVPKFESTDSSLMAAFADTIQHALQQLEALGVRAWIIDLRNNMGGNMAPMVAGLGPLFDPGTLGQLIDVEGKVEHWSYMDGIYGWDGETTMRIAHPVVLKKRLPIAVLLDQRTGSSGECTAISFIGNSHTRSFGQPTWGLTTGNGEFDLPDGAKMFLASTVMADRNGHAFDGPITPDEVVEQPADWSYDAAVTAALAWIAKQH